MKKLLLQLITHTVAAVIGFAGGIYALPILTAPPAPTSSDVQKVASLAHLKGEFRRELKGSDLLHWGEGEIFVSKSAISLKGALAPGPNYKLYLSPEFVETKADFIRLKENMIRVGDIKTFENFVVQVPESIDPNAYNTVVVWCESFEQFITAAKYQ